MPSDDTTPSGLIFPWSASNPTSTAEEPSGQSAQSSGSALSQPRLRIVLQSITIFLLTAALANALGLHYLVQALITDMGEHSFAISIALVAAIALGITATLVLFPRAKLSVHGDIFSIGIFTFAVIAWVNMIWGGIEDLTTPLDVPISFSAAAYVILATTLLCFVEVFTAANMIDGRFKTAAVRSVFYIGVAGWMLTAVYGLFGSFITDMIVAELTSDMESGASRPATPEEMRQLKDCWIGDSHLVLCRLPLDSEGTYPDPTAQ